MPEIAEVLSTTHHRERKLDDGGTLYYFKVKTDDGTIAEAGKKKSDTPPQKGDRYKNLRQPSENAPSGALPQLLKPITDFQSNGKSGKSFDADPRKLRAENMRSAIHAAIAFRQPCLDQVKPSDLLMLAEDFYNAIERVAQVGAAVSGEGTIRGDDGGNRAKTDPQAAQSSEPVPSPDTEAQSGAELLKRRCQALGVTGDVVIAKLKELQMPDRLSLLDAIQLAEFDKWLDTVEADAAIPFD